MRKEIEDKAKTYLATIFQILVGLTIRNIETGMGKDEARAAALNRAKRDYPELMEWANAAYAKISEQ